MNFFHNDYAGKRISFHLKNGITHIGVVLDDIDDMIELERLSDKERIIFHKNLIAHYILLDSPTGINLIRQRAGYISSVRTPIYNQRKFKKLIILGAGASADTGNDISIPTTNQLFEDNQYLQHFEGANKLRYKILPAIKNGRTLEDYFEQLWHEIENTGDLKQLSQLINTQYYIQFLIHISSAHSMSQANGNYFRLIDLVDQYLRRVKNESVAIVTFNYDTFLENTLSSMFDCRFTGDRSYLYNNVNGQENHNKILVFKPHGSWNWIYDISIPLKGLERNRVKGTQAIAKKIYESNMSLYEILSSIIGVGNIEKSDLLLHELQMLLTQKMQIVNHTYKFDRPYYPNLLIPFKNKDHFVMPRSHISKLEAIFPEVEEILVIGWKGTENEFNSLLKRKLKDKKLEIQFVSTRTNTVESELRKYLSNATFHPNYGGFSSWLNNVSKGGRTNALFKIN